MCIPDMCFSLEPAHMTIVQDGPTFDALCQMWYWEKDKELPKTQSFLPPALPSLPLSFLFFFFGVAGEAFPGHT